MNSQFENWKKTQEESLDGWEYANRNLTLYDVLYLGELLFPRIVEFEECVFLEAHFSENQFRNWHYELKGDLSAVEHMINHVHVYDVFDKAEMDTPEWAFEEVAQLLFDSWKMWFETKHPALHIEVHRWGSDAEYGPTLSFCRKRA